MKITSDMVEHAAKLAWGTGNGCAWENTIGIVKDQCRVEARAVLEYAATLGPTREERLRDYRCAVAVAWGGSGATPERIEERAHAMLAAERPADPARDESGDAAPVLRKALALALRALKDPTNEALRNEVIAAVGPAVDGASALDPEPMPGSLSGQVAAYLAAGNESTVEYIAERLHSNPVDVRAVLFDLQASGKADILSGSALWHRVPR